MCFWSLLANSWENIHLLKAKNNQITGKQAAGSLVIHSKCKSISRECQSVCSSLELPCWLLPRNLVVREINCSALLCQ